MPKDTKLVRIKVSTETNILKVIGTYQAETGKRLSIDEAIVMLLNGNVLNNMENT